MFNRPAPPRLFAAIALIFQAACSGSDQITGTPPEPVAVGGSAPPAAPAIATSITVLRGDNQRVMAGRAAEPVVFVVRDQIGNVLPGVPVGFTLVGGGSLAGSVITSGLDGSVIAPAWKVGTSAVPQQLRATSGSLAAAANATIESSFGISVRYYGPAMSPTHQALFTAAAQRISALVVGDLPDVNAAGIDLATFCETPGLPVLNEIVDDVVIYASVKAIDGPGKVLAQAGPCAIRSGGSNLPIIGIMEFDEADLVAMAGQGSLQEVITHEMMHVLGIGTFWNSSSLLADYNTSTVSYLGAAGASGCREAGGASLCASTVPVENVGGAGTANAHWRESVFGNEIMTGYANSGGMPISRMTIGAFADLGYVTNPDAASLYQIPGTAGNASSAASFSLAGGRPAAWERTIEPKILISRSGQVEKRQ